MKMEYETEEQYQARETARKLDEDRKKANKEAVKLVFRGLFLK